MLSPSVGGPLFGGTVWFTATDPRSTASREPARSKGQGHGVAISYTEWLTVTNFTQTSDLVSLRLQRWALEVKPSLIKVTRYLVD